MALNLTNMTFGSLTAIRVVAQSKKGNMWECKCECGKTVVKQANKLKEGAIKSCGCKWHAHSTTHNMTNTRIYRIWSAIKTRCTNPNIPNSKNYSGRGISMCDRWRIFENFYEDMKDGYSDDLSIDRIDNNGNYCKENCKWSTRAEQMRNNRRNYWHEIDGIRMIKKDWAADLGIHHSLIDEKLRKGFSFDEIYDFYKNRRHHKIKDQINENLLQAQVPNRNFPK